MWTLSKDSRTECPLSTGALVVLVNVARCFAALYVCVDG